MTDSVPPDLAYHPAHGWARVDGDEATLGITDHAQDELGEIVFWEVPEAGTPVRAGESYTELESTKAVSDVIAPLSGEIVAVNDAIADTPEKINDDPYGDGWLVKIRLSNPGEAGELLSADAYKESIGG